MSVWIVALFQNQECISIDVLPNIREARRRVELHCHRWDPDWVLLPRCDESSTYLQDGGPAFTDRHAIFAMREVP